jgi:hypothetical protein
MNPFFRFLSLLRQWFPLPYLQSSVLLRHPHFHEGKAVLSCAQSNPETQEFGQRLLLMCRSLEVGSEICTSLEEALHGLQASNQCAKPNKEIY